MADSSPLGKPEQKSWAKIAQTRVAGHGSSECSCEMAEMASGGLAGRRFS